MGSRRGGAPPKDDASRRNHSPPAHPWQYAAGAGWQHGEVPNPPSKLTKAAKEAWATWFASWFAWFWGPEDIPGLRQLVRLYDQVERGEFQRHSELRLAMDNYGVSPKGQQDRRWRPQGREVPKPAAEEESTAKSQRWGDLQVVDA